MMDKYRGLMYNRIGKCFKRRSDRHLGVDFARVSCIRKASKRARAATRRHKTALLGRVPDANRMMTGKGNDTMKKRLIYRLGSFLVTVAMLLPLGGGIVPTVAEDLTQEEGEEGDTQTMQLEMFQSSSVYDMGIDHENVRLGWRMTASWRGMYQTAYHVVITDEEGATAWDSGWVESDVQVGIVAQNLKPETIYTAKVQVKDEQGRESEFSKDFVFETAPAALEGEWLTSERLLRETFTLDQPLANVERARCYMTSAGLIELRLNGEKIGDLVWNPSRNFHEKIVTYSTFDITDMLLDGMNAVGAYTSTNQAYHGGATVTNNLRGMLRIRYKDGSVQTVSTGDGWTTCATSEITRTSINTGEDIDARKRTNWDTPGFVEDANWKATTGAAWPIRNGELTVPDNAGRYYTYQTFSGDYTIELSVTITSASTGLMFGAAEIGEAPLMWQILKGSLRIHMPDWKDVKTVSVPSIKIGEKVTMKLDIQGNTVTTYINGTQVDVTTVPDGETVGALGIRHYIGEVASYDRLAVTQNGELVWEDTFDTYDLDKWNFPVAPDPEIRPDITGSTVIAEIKPVSVTEIQKNGKTSYVLDFGRNMQGVVRLDTKGQSGVSYLIEYAELLDKDNPELSGEPVGDIWANTTYHLPKSTYTLSGGEDSFMPRFFYTGFRYVKVTPSDGSAIDPDDFTACFMSEDLPQTGFFESSDQRLNAVFAAYLQAQRCGVIGGIYAACPGREKAFWTGDASVTKESTLLVLNDYATSEAGMRVMIDNIQENGAPHNLLVLVPDATYNDNWNIGWTSSYFVFPYETYMTTGDPYYIELYCDELLALFDFFVGAKTSDKEYIKDGTVSDWLGYDHLEGKVDTSFLQTAYFYYNGKLLSEMMEIIGRDHTELDATLEKTYNAIQTHFYNQNGYYSSALQTTNSVALDLGLVPEEHTDAVLATLLAACDNSNRTLRTGVLGTKSIYDALSPANEHKVLMDLTLNPEKASFGYMIDSGATTLREHWDNAGETNMSHNKPPYLALLDSQNHAMYGGGVATWMFEGLGGITNTGAGYKQSTFRPGIESGLAYAKTSISPLVGTLKSDWTYEQGVLTWDVEVPANTTATVIIPLPTATAITESGVDILAKDGDGITYEGTNENGEHVYTVGGGSYKFVATAPHVEPEEPDGDTTTTEPVDDPADGTTTEPADDGTTTEPADDGNTTTEPADDATTTEPADGPAEGSTTAEPTTDPVGGTDDASGCGSSGCGSTLGVSVLSFLLMALAAAWIRKKAD